MYLWWCLYEFFFSYCVGCFYQIVSVLMVNVLFTDWMLAGTMGGFVYFNEIAEMSGLSKAMFFLGTLISILGIVILSSRAPPVGSRAERYGKLDVSDELDSMVEDGLGDEALEGVAGGGQEGRKRRKGKKGKKGKREKRGIEESESSGSESSTSGSGSEGDIELHTRQRTRTNSDVIVQRVAGAFVLTMSDSDGSPNNSPRSSVASRHSPLSGSSPPQTESFAKYADQPEVDSV